MPIDATGAPETGHCRIACFRCESTGEEVIYEAEGEYGEHIDIADGAAITCPLCGGARYLDLPLTPAQTRELSRGEEIDLDAGVFSELSTIENGWGCPADHDEEVTAAFGAEVRQ